MQWVKHVEHNEETGEEKVIQKYQQPCLDCVIGPFWPFLLFVTYPLILGISLWTLLIAIPSKHILVKLLWGCLTSAPIYFLAKMACTDPGILYHHHHIPPQEKNQWLWSDQGQTNCPHGAHFDTDCAIVVEGFDHM